MLLVWAEVRDPAVPKRAAELVREMKADLASKPVLKSGPGAETPIKNLAKSLLSNTKKQILADQPETKKMAEINHLLEDKPTQAPTVGSKDAQIADAEVDFVTLRVIKFKGNRAISSDDLLKVAAKFVGIPLGMQDFSDISATVENYYKDHNFIARVVPVPQDLTDGVLELDVIESVLSKVKVEEGLPSMPMTESQILALLGSQQATGTHLNTKSLDRGLSLANELPGVNVSGTLKEGDAQGETDLILKMYKYRTREEELIVDNHGSFSTGRERLTASLSLFEPASVGDLLSLLAVHTKGSDYFRSAYGLPIGELGWRISANISAMHYQVVQGMAGVAGAVGKAVTQGIELAYPLVRSTNSSSTVTLSADNKQFDNVSAQGLDLSNYKTHVAAAQISGMKRDIAGADSLATYSATVSRGDINLEGSMSQAADQMGPHTEGLFSKVRLNGTITEPITDTTSFFSSFTSQRSNKNLDTSEKMQLGGESGVRAFPTGEGAGSEGEMVSFELRQMVNENVRLSVFYDIGRIYQYRDAAYPGGPQNNAYVLKGYGLGFAYTAADGLQFKMTWATRQGDNPNPTQTGMDQDGTYDRNRYWLQVSMPFQ